MTIHEREQIDYYLKTDKEIYWLSAWGFNSKLSQVASSSKTSREALIEIGEAAVSFRDFHLFNALINNSNCPEEVLLNFIENNMLNNNIFKNPNLTKESIIKLISKKKFEALINSNCPVDLLLKYSSEDEFLYIDKINNSSNYFLKEDESYSKDMIFLIIAGNPNCTKTVFENLLKGNFPVVNIAIAQNPACPVELLRELYKFKYARKAVLMNLNCPEDILFDASLNRNPKEKDQLLLVYNNPNSTLDIKYNCLSYFSENGLDKISGIPKEFLSLYELGVRTNHISNYKDAFYYLFFDLYLKNSNTKKTISNSMINNINEKIMNPDFPEEILYYYYISFYKNPNLSSYFTPEAFNKIRSISLKAEMYFEDGLKYKDYYMAKISESLLLAIGQKDDCLGNTNVYPFLKDIDIITIDDTVHRSDLSIIQNSSIGSKIVIKLDNYDNSLDDKLQNGVIEFGFYPQKKVSESEKLMLDILLANNGLDLSGKKYTFVGLLGERKCSEYLVNDRRFIKYNNEWIEVKPIKWIFDRRNMTLTSIKDLLGEKKSRTKDRTIKVFFEEVFSEYADPQKSLEELNKKKGNNDDIIAAAKKAIQRQEEQEKLLLIKLKKKKIIEKELKDIDEINRKLGILEDSEKQTRTELYKREDVDLDFLLVKVDDHFEINPKYIPYLKFINLNLINANNLKVSGLDLSETNLVIRNPRDVYEMDFSGCSLGPNNISLFSDFSDCNLCGTDFSKFDEEGIIFHAYFENSIMDEKTKLPSLGEVKKNKSLN